MNHHHQQHTPTPAVNHHHHREPPSPPSPTDPETISQHHHEPKSGNNLTATEQIGTTKVVWEHKPTQQHKHKPHAGNTPHPPTDLHFIPREKKKKPQELRSVGHRRRRSTLATHDPRNPCLPNPMANEPRKIGLPPIRKSHWLEIERERAEQRETERKKKKKKREEREDRIKHNKNFIQVATVTCIIIYYCSNV